LIIFFAQKNLPLCVYNYVYLWFLIPNFKKTVFSTLNLIPALCATAQKLGYTEPTPIQTAAIPTILKGSDVLAIAQTGSGKTAAFVLPILQAFQTKKIGKNRCIKTLVLVPTRELAMQVGEVFAAFSTKNLKRSVKTLAVFGGVSINPQMMHLHHVEVLIATPGRLLDLLEHRALSIAEVDTLVLDEADKMLNMGFRDEMARIFALLPEKRQNLLFSATLSPDISALSTLILQNPITIEIAAADENTDLIAQTAYLTTEARKGPLLRYLIKTNELKQVLIFASSIHKADSIVRKLKQNGISALAIHSEKSQGARTEALRYFKTGEINVLVATDLVSRGIDIPNLPTVINYELPRSPKDFVHRIGRTGRAGADGTAISLITEEDATHFRVIEKKMSKRVERVDTQDFNLHGF
jgi:ATP-dependent RNA helicase RhlE